MSGRTRQDGFVLLPVVLLITLVAVAAFSVSQLGSREIRSTAGQAEALRAERVAQSGLEHAAWLTQNSGCGGDMTLPATPLGTDSYTATVTTGSGSSSYTLSADQDAWVRESTPATNYGLDGELSAKHQSADNMRALYRFDLGVIPSGSTISSAVAWFYATSSDGQGAVALHRITADWTEADATWASMGERFDEQVLAMIPAQSTDGVWVRVNLTAQVQAWLNGAQPNYGVMLVASSDAVVSRFASREWTTFDERPRLEVVAVSGAASPASISATGTLASGISRDLTREAITVYQPASTFVWQPGAELEDAYIWDGAHKAKNFGVSPILNLSTGRNVLVRFSLDSLPPGAQIADARLELYLQSGTGVSNAVLDLHALKRRWVEGIYDDGRPGTGEGVTYDTYDGGNSWTTPGGDYYADIVDSVTVPSAVPAWYSWNVKRQLQAWREGVSNYGFMLIGGGGTLGDINFVSSDDDTVPQFHPRLTVTLRCECGVACLLPQGSGKLLFVVADAANLTTGESALQAAFESWGYVVTPVSDDASQAVYDADLSTHDVVYVSQAASSSAIGTKLANAAIGVVTEQGGLNANLGIAAGSATVVGASLQVVNNAHYITGPFGDGSLPIYSAAMEGATVSGSPAPGAEILADWGSAGGLVVLEQGAQTTGGGAAPGRRVTLPLGRATAAKFDWDYLNGNGRLMVQRAVQWGTGNTDGGGEPFVCNGTYLDTFDSPDWNGDDGSITPWANPWGEVGESDGASQGDVQIATDESSYQLQIQDNDNGGEGVEREVDLSGASTATLSFDYRRADLDNADDYVGVYVSAAGTGGPWTEIARIAGGDNDASYQTSTYDISAYISAQTAIRLRSSPTMGVRDIVWFDNVQIQCVP